MSAPMTCVDCGGLIRVTIEPYELIKLVVFTCRKCGIKYDTPLQYAIKREGANG
jgi:hypothetical protein